MGPVHHYALSIDWTAGPAGGTTDYRSYSRNHVVQTGTGQSQRPMPILGSSDRAFRGDPNRWNPEQLLVASLSQCHLLTYLHLAVLAGVVVTGYRDEPVGTMIEDGHNGGQFREVVLHPFVTVSDEAMIESALALHAEVGRFCFIARSVNFPVRHKPRVVTA